MTYADLLLDVVEDYRSMCDGDEYSPTDKQWKQIAYLRTLAELLSKIDRPLVDEVWCDGHVDCSDTLYALIDPLSDP